AGEGTRRAAVRAARPEGGVDDGGRSPSRTRAAGAVSPRTGARGGGGGPRLAARAARDRRVAQRGRDAAAEGARRVPRRTPGYRGAVDRTQPVGRVRAHGPGRRAR